MMITQDLNRLLKTVPAAVAPIASSLAAKNVTVRMQGRPSTDGRVIFTGPCPVSEKGIALLLAFLYHEAAHICFTDFSVRIDPALKKLVNALEDIRIEKKMNERLPGGFLWRARCIEILTQEKKALACSADADPITLVTCALFWNLSSSLLGYPASKLQAKVAHAHYLSRYPEAMWLQSCMIAADVAQAESTQEVLEIAKSIAKLHGWQGHWPAQTEKKRRRAARQSLLPLPPEEAGLDIGRAGAELLEQTQSQARSQCTDASMLYEIWPARRTRLPSAAWQDFASRARALCQKQISRLRRCLEARERDYLNLSRAGQQVLPSALSRLFVGDSRVFRTESVVRKPSMAVAILVDRSGSMDAKTMDSAKQCAFAMAELVDSSAGCASTVLCFPGKEPRTLLQLKAFGESAASQVERFAATDAFGATPVTEAVLGAAALLAGRRESRRVIFMITDGLLSGTDSVKKLARQLSATGVEVYCLSIGQDSESVFDHQVNINAPSEMPTAVYEMLKAGLLLN